MRIIIRYRAGPRVCPVSYRGQIHIFLTPAVFPLFWTINW